MKKIFFSSKKGYIVSFCICFIIFFTYMFSNMTSEINTFSHIIFYVDGLFIAGFVCVCVGGLVGVHQLGAFDTFSYAFGGRKKTQATSLSDYSEKKVEERKKTKFDFVPYLTFGFIIILISILLNVILFSL